MLRTKSPAGARNLNILLALFQVDRRGGKERDCLAIADALAERGHCVTIVTTSERPAGLSDLHWATLRAPGFTNHSRMRSFSTAVSAYRSQRPADLLLAFENVPGCDFLYAAEDAVAFKPRDFRWLLPRRKTQLSLERGVFEKGGPFIFFLTQRQRNEYKACYDFDPARCVVLPLILHDERYRQVAVHNDRTQIRKQLGIPATAAVAISVGASSVLARKGVDRTLAALSSFPDLYLVIVGSEDRRLTHMVKTMKLEQRVRIVPYLSNVMDLLSASDFMVHPARAESAGQVIGEALLAGAPAIVSGICGYASEIAETGAGIVLPEPFRQTDLVKAIADLQAKLPAFRQVAAQESLHQQALRGRWLSIIVDTLENRAGWTS